MRAVSDPYNGAVWFHNTKISSMAAKRVARSLWLRSRYTQGWQGTKPMTVRMEYHQQIVESPAIDCNPVKAL